MFSNLVICFGVAACLCQLVTSQGWQQQSSTASSAVNTTQLGTMAPLNASTWNQQQQQAGNASSAPMLNQAPVTNFFGQVLRGEVLGLRKCKKPKDCGLGLRCDLLLNLCVPFNTPILQDIEKPCSNDSECSGMHACQGGLCRFCGPKSCRSSLDCCAGSFAQAGQQGSFYECLNIEDQDKLSIARQLGRVPPGYQPIPKAAGGKSIDEAFEVESEELVQLGLPVQDSAFYGKRCWARCNVDTDCYHEKTPADIKQTLGCCNNVCNRKAACTVLSPQVVQQAQQLQQQRLQQQQVFQQQQAMINQQQLLRGQAHHAAPQGQQSAWGAAGHQFQQPQQQYAQPAAPQQQQPQVQYIPVPVQVITSRPAPLSWQEAQQQGPSQQYGAQRMF